ERSSATPRSRTGGRSPSGRAARRASSRSTSPTPIDRNQATDIDLGASLTPAVAGLNLSRIRMRYDNRPRSALRKPLAALAVALALWLAAGCGYLGRGVGTGVLVVGDGSSGGGGRLDVGSDISAAIVLPLAREPGPKQRVRVRLADREGRPLPIRLDFRGADT